MNTNVSHNWQDPAAFGPSPPWLDINVAASSLGDRTNLGEFGAGFVGCRAHLLGQVAVFLWTRARSAPSMG